jgi:hypothetical protein
MAVLPDGHNVSFEHARKRLDLTMHIFLNAMPLGGASLVRIAQFGRIMTGTTSVALWCPARRLMHLGTGLRLVLGNLATASLGVVHACE